MNVPSRLSFDFFQFQCQLNTLSRKTNLYFLPFHLQKKHNKNKNKGLIESGYGIIIKFNPKFTQTF